MVVGTQSYSMFTYIQTWTFLSNTAIYLFSFFSGDRKRRDEGDECEDDESGDDDDDDGNQTYIHLI